MVTERVRFESQEIMLGGRLVLPDEGETASAVVCITGGGKDHCDTSYLEWQTYLADEAGISSLAFNSRGIGDSDGSFRTDSEGFDPVFAPANSQATRTQDAVTAYNLLKKKLSLDDDSTGVIGGSMGGDVAAHTLDFISPAAVVLRAPSAYPDGVHEVEFGPAWGPVIRSLGGDEAALRSSNFARIRNLEIPILAIFSRGEAVIPQSIQNAYAEAVVDAGGQFIEVGDEAVPHTFINEKSRPEKDTPKNALARQEVYEMTAQFFAQNLNIAKVK